MERVKCLWCNGEFDWDSSMYRFCDNCIAKIEEVELIVERITKVRVNLAKDLEVSIGGKLWGD